MKQLRWIPRWWCKPPEQNLHYIFVKLSWCCSSRWASVIASAALMMNPGRYRDLLGQCRKPNNTCYLTEKSCSLWRVLFQSRVASENSWSSSGLMPLRFISSQTVARRTSHYLLKAEQTTYSGIWELVGFFGARYHSLSFFYFLSSHNKMNKPLSVEIRDNLHGVACENSSSRLLPCIYMLFRATARWLSNYLLKSGDNLHRVASENWWSSCGLDTTPFLQSSPTNNSKMNKPRVQGDSLIRPTIEIARARKQLMIIYMNLGISLSSSFLCTVLWVPGPTTLE
jgi:hypothetical protein